MPKLEDNKILKQQYPKKRTAKIICPDNAAKNCMQTKKSKGKEIMDAIAIEASKPKTKTKLK